MFSVVLALATTIYRGQNPGEARIDFSCPATRAEIVLRQLSEKVGSRLRPNPTLASDVFVIRVQNVTVQDLMDRIAKSAAALWIRDGETLYLSPSREAEVGSIRRSPATSAVGCELRSRLSCRRPRRRNLGTNPPHCASPPTPRPP